MDFQPLKKEMNDQFLHLPHEKKAMLTQKGNSTVDIV